jgi:predicted XRE-type DNA-binding protein
MKSKNRKKRGTKIAVEESSGNVFADLGLPNPEALLEKSKIIGKIRDTMEEHRMTDRAVAKVIGISSHDLDQVFRGDLDRYSKRDLKRFLTILLSFATVLKNGERNKKKRLPPSKR